MNNENINISNQNNQYNLALLVTGARKFNLQNSSTTSTKTSNYTLENIIQDEFTKLKNKYNTIFLIEGEAEGVDLTAKSIGEKFSFTISAFKPDWKKYGRAAGPIRNLEMVKKLLVFKNKGCSVLVQAYHNDLENSRGTKNTIEQCLKKIKDVEVQLFGSNKERMKVSLKDELKCRVNKSIKMSVKMSVKMNVEKNVKKNIKIDKNELLTKRNKFCYELLN